MTRRLGLEAQPSEYYKDRIENYYKKDKLK